MGGEGLKQLLKRKDKFNIITIVRPSKKNKIKMAKYEKMPGVQIIWGDLTNYEDVNRAVIEADYVLHVAAFISPKADYEPEKAWEINVGSTENIIKSIKSQPNKDNIKLIYIGSVAQTGDRMPPIHWGRTGDPLKPSIYDNYAVTKNAAERLVVDSGLKYWVSLRQTGIAHFDLFHVNDGIMFHQPLENCFEWVTAHDAGLLLAHICEKSLPEDFWRRIYNIGGGQSCRTTGYEFLDMMYKAIGLKDIKKLYEPNWFATQNFHGQWYEDSDVLNDYLDFRRESLDDFIEQLKKVLPFKIKILKYLPKSLVKKYAMVPLSLTRNGTMYWIKKDLKDRISAFWGSKKKWLKIPNWDKYEYKIPSSHPIRLNHGYDESKPKSELCIEDMKMAAIFRGGKCLSEYMVKGDLNTKLKWECAFGHEFEGSPTLVLLGGHWCPECEAPPWNYDEIAKKNPFFAQVWYPIHDKNQNNYYSANCYKDIT